MYVLLSTFVSEVGKETGCKKKNNYIVLKMYCASFGEGERNFLGPPRPFNIFLYVIHLTALPASL